jgi:hypothetical protein
VSKLATFGFEFLSPSEVADFFDHLDIDDEEYEELFDNINANYASLKVRTLFVIMH